MTLLATSVARPVHPELHIQELIALAKAGDPDALDTLYRRYGDGVMLVAYSLRSLSFGRASAGRLWKHCSE